MNGGNVVGLTSEGDSLGGNGRERLNVYMKFWKGLHVPPLSIDFCFGVRYSITRSIRASQAVSANSIRNELTRYTGPGSESSAYHGRLCGLTIPV